MSKQVKNQYYITDYFCDHTERENEEIIREQFPIECISTTGHWYPEGYIYCCAFGTRFVIPHLTNRAPDWELLSLTLKRASKGNFRHIRRIYDS